MNLAANFQTLQQDCEFINQLPTKCILNAYLYIYIYMILQSNLKMHSQKNSDLPRFCKLALRSVIDGVDNEKISKAAKSLEQDEDIVKNAVRALAQILTMLASASVYVVPQKVYKETLIPMKLNNEASDTIYKYYETVHNVLRDVLRQFKIETSRYHKFDWRLDIQIGSRALHRRVDPVFLCELQTSTTKGNNNHNNNNNNNNNNNDNDDEKDIQQQQKNDNNNNKNDIIEFEKTLFETNFATLENMIEQFEQALRETQQSWYKKVSRQTK